MPSKNDNNILYRVADGRRTSIGPKPGPFEILLPYRTDRILFAALVENACSHSMEFIIISSSQRRTMRCLNFI